jgi:hypothetical protein
MAMEMTESKAWKADISTFHAPYEARTCSGANEAHISRCQVFLKSAKNGQAAELYYGLVAVRFGDGICTLSGRMPCL